MCCISAILKEFHSHVVFSKSENIHQVVLCSKIAILAYACRQYETSLRTIVSNYVLPKGPVRTSFSPKYTVRESSGCVCDRILRRTCVMDFLRASNLNTPVSVFWHCTRLFHLPGNDYFHAIRGTWILDRMTIDSIDLYSP